MLGLKRDKRIVNRILIVEDEPLVAADNEQFLRGKGYEVVATVDTAHDALAIIAVNLVDCLLCDIRIADGGNGIEVARAAEAKGIKVLFATGSAEELGSGVGVGYLKKPYGPRDLLQALDIVDRIARGADLPRIPPALTLFSAAS